MSKSIGFQPEVLAKALGVRRVDLENGLTEILDAHYSGKEGSIVTSVNSQIGDVLLIASDIQVNVDENIEDVLTNLGEEQDTIKHNQDIYSDRLDALEGVTRLYPVNYGDFNNESWLSLSSGTYYMVARHDELTNAPFEDEEAGATYILALEITTSPNYYVHQLHVVAQGFDASPLVYSRGGNNTLADLSVRQWADLAGEGGGGITPDIPVTSVNTKTGDVVLDASDINITGHGTVEDMVLANITDISTLQGDVIDLSKILDVKALDFNTFKDFNSPQWLTLPNGNYYLEGAFKDFSDLPFGVDNVNDVYGIHVRMIIDSTRYYETLSAFNLNSHSAPVVFARGGAKTSSDMLLHIWADLTSVNAGGGGEDNLVFSVNTKVGDVVLGADDINRSNGATVEDSLHNLETETIDFPVDTVNGRTGDVILTASNVSRETSSKTIEESLDALESATPSLSASEISEVHEGDVQTALNTNNTLIAGLQTSVSSVDDKVDGLTASDIGEALTTSVQARLNDLQADVNTVDGRVDGLGSLIDANKDDIADINSRVDGGFDALHALTTLTGLSPTLYGDLNDPVWFSLEDGGYFITAYYNQFSNLPFAEDVGTREYTLQFEVRNDALKYIHKLHVTPTDNVEAPLVFERSGDTNDADLSARAWANLASTFELQDATTVLRADGVKTVEESLVTLEAGGGGGVKTIDFIKYTFPVYTSKRLTKDVDYNFNTFMSQDKVYGDIYYSDGTMGTTQWQGWFDYSDQFVFKNLLNKKLINMSLSFKFNTSSSITYMPYFSIKTENSSIPTSYVIRPDTRQKYGYYQSGLFIPQIPFMGMTEDDSVRLIVSMSRCNGVEFKNMEDIVVILS